MNSKSPVLKEIEKEKEYRKRITKKPRPIKNPEKIEQENLEDRQKSLNKKWNDYLKNLSRENLNRKYLVELMSELNEFDYKLTVLKRRDLLG